MSALQGFLESHFFSSGMNEPMNLDLYATGVAGDETLREARRTMSRLSQRLAAGELELRDTRIALARFEEVYYARLGSKYAELDEILARIAEVKAAGCDEGDIPSEQARRAREQAERSAGEYRRRAVETLHPEPRPKVAAEIKKLYRKIAARIHPDRAVDEESRSIRTRLMAELNEAYARGDAARMRDIFSRWEEGKEGEGNPEEELGRLARAMERFKNRIGIIEQELERIRRSPLGVLMEKVREADALGRDLLAILAEELDLKISLAKRTLRELEEAGG